MRGERKLVRRKQIGGPDVILTVLREFMLNQHQSARHAVYEYMPVNRQAVKLVSTKQF